MGRLFRLRAAHSLFLGCWLGLLAALPACTRRAEGEKEVFPASGEMFVGGQPATGARLAFHPVQDDSQDQWPGGFPRAVVDEAGKFMVETYRVRDGCPAGDYVVLVTWPATLPGEANSEEAETVDRLEGRYAARESSTLKAKVESKPTDLGRYELK
jgi:hypothetical protein